MEPTHYLARRENWQLAANQGGACAEKDVSSCIKSYLDATQPGEWIVESHPKDLSQIYLEYDREQNPTAYEMPIEPVKGDIWYDPEKKYFLRSSTSPRGEDVSSSVRIKGQQEMLMSVLQSSRPLP